MKQTNLLSAFCLFLLLSGQALSQNYQVTLDSTSVDSINYQAHLIIDDQPDDSLIYAIDLYAYVNQDSSRVYRDTFYYHNPKVTAFKSIDFKYQSDKVYLTLEEFEKTPFLVQVHVLNKTNNLLNTVNLNQYK